LLCFAFLHDCFGGFGAALFELHQRAYGAFEPESKAFTEFRFTIASVLKESNSSSGGANSLGDHRASRAATSSPNAAVRVQRLPADFSSLISALMVVRATPESIAGTPRSDLHLCACR
jgi:hypothetical protein